MRPSNRSSRPTTKPTLPLPKALQRSRQAPGCSFQRRHHQRSNPRHPPLRLCSRQIAALPLLRALAARSTSPCSRHHGGSGSLLLRSTRSLRPSRDLQLLSKPATASSRHRIARRSQLKMQDVSGGPLYLPLRRRYRECRRRRRSRNSSKGTGSTLRSPGCRGRQWRRIRQQWQMGALRLLRRGAGLVRSASCRIRRDRYLESTSEVSWR